MDTGRRRPWGRAVAIAVILIVVILLLLTPTVQTLLRSILFSPFQQRYPESATFSLQRTLSLDANGGTVRNFSVDLPMPVNISQNGHKLQEVKALSFTPQNNLSEDRYGVPWTTWEGGELTGSQTSSITIRYSIQSYARIWDIDESKSLTTSDVPSYLKEKYLKDEWKIQMSDPSITAASRTIVGEEKNVYTILSNIYQWVTANIDYPSGSNGGEPKSATETLASKVGDCDDQAILFCSLARAAGVPAWLQLGVMHVTISNNWGGHGWVQAYIPTKDDGENVTIDTVNKDFLVWRPNRFADFTDDGNGNHLYDYYYTFLSNYITDTYPPYHSPNYSESYEALSYVESDRKISASSTLEMCVQPSARLKPS